MRDTIQCEIRIADGVEGQPSRLSGIIMPYGQQAADRREVFEPGSLKWDGPLVLNRMHRRDSPILRFTPIETGDKLTLDVELPDTVAGRDARSEVKSGLMTGMSIEFTAIRESVVGGVRRITSALLSAAALVDAASYQGATVEARARADAEERERARRRRAAVL